QSDGGLIIGGSFADIGGAGTVSTAVVQSGGTGGGRRDGISQRNNLARIIGGSTPGPGNIQLTENSYSADENGGLYFVTMERVNGHLGEAGVTVSPRTLAPGPGAAVAGVDFTFDAATF